MAENMEWGVITGFFFQKVIKSFTRRDAAILTLTVGGVSRATKEAGGAAGVMV